MTPSLSLSDELEFDVIITNKTDQIVSIVDERTDLGSLVTSGHSFRYSIVGDSESHDTVYCAPFMKISSVNKVTTLNPHFKQITSVKITYLDKFDHYDFFSDKYDKHGPVLYFTKYLIPAKPKTTYKIWVEYDQSNASENFIQKKRGINLWKGKVMSNAVLVHVK